MDSNSNYEPNGSLRMSDGRNHYRLDFDDQSEAFLVNFYEPETVEDSCFRWSEPLAMVRFDVPANDYDVVIETGSLRGEDCNFQFRIYWNDQLISKSAIKVSEGRIAFSVARDMFIQNDEQRLTISCKPLNAENGRRKLGMPIRWIRFSQMGQQLQEFKNPTKTRSRIWRRENALPKLRHLMGMKSPSPHLPIWEMKLPSVTSMLTPEQPAFCNAEPRVTDTVVVSSVEINSRHGTGLLIQYMFEDFSNIATVSSHRCFHGDRVRSAVHYEVPYEEMPRHELYSMVLDWFRSSPPKRAYVVPFYRTELMVAIAMADLFGTRVCVHVMDDQCIYEDEIPDELMIEAMDKASVVMTISPEMKNAYQQRFGRRVYILPPIVPRSMILGHQPCEAETTGKGKQTLASKVRHFFSGNTSESTASKRGILIGNVWDPKWLEMLQQTISGSGVEVDWYSNNPDAMMLNGKGQELANAGIYLKEPLWGDALVQELRRRPFAIMPSGTLCKDEPRESVARLSLPSRVPFVTSVSQIPIIVLGSRETAAAQFVTRFELGAVVDYEPNQYKRAVEHVLQPEFQSGVRSRAASVARTFSAEGLKNWLWNSVHLGQPVDNRFEDLFAEAESDAALFDDSVAKLQSCWRKDDTQSILTRLKDQGIRPIRIIDVGARDGSWSWSASQVYPDAEYILFEPLPNRFNQQSREHYLKSLHRSHIIEAALGDCDCESEFKYSVDAAGKTLFNIPAEATGWQSAKVQVNRLDQLARSHGWSGSTIMKIDVASAEHLVLAGGKEFVSRNVDVVLLELTINKKHPAAKSYRDMLYLMDELGFELVDEMEARRCLKTGQLLQKNTVFVKRTCQEIRQAA